ncbi:TonB-dependent receptor [Rhizosaccharibacter radicis]|uniref:TonB-dependent receptor n=1 Tax=Rhizosaccharibacter radicis TaxID=2782605 RepID=A0ABT1W0G0_9PROT|nr:TonB-dependent receptor [Acetobacteraceae bacterium KSS12]
MFRQHIASRRFALLLAGSTTVAGLPALAAPAPIAAVPPAAVSTAAVSAPNSQAGAPDGSEQAENITVSANKRRQRTRDVAGSVTVLTGKQLQALGAQSFADYLRLAPGAVFSEGVPGLSTVSFRGITDTNLLDQGQGTTGYFLNDVPLAEPGFAIAIPDIDTFDVSRVEILRGPQSTLFGSATLGGAVDYIANTADTHKYDAAFESSVLGVEGGDVGYTEKGMVNIPLIRDKLAVRGVLEYRQDPGYVDNVGTGEHGANQDLLRNARVSVTYEPTDGTKLTYLYLAQNNKISDQGYSQPFVGEYNKFTLIAEPYYTATQLHSLRLDQELSFGTLTGQAAFTRKNQYLGADYSAFYAGALGSLSPYSAPQTGDSKSMYYELRVASHDHQTVTWLAGAAYYQTWKRINAMLGVPGAQQYLAGLYGPQVAQSYAPDGDTFSQIIGDYDGSEESLFGEASYHGPAHLTFTFGGRLYWTSVTSSSENYGYYTALANDGTPFSPGHAATSDNGFLPKISLRWEPSRQFMAYGLISEGYRFGQPNVVTPDPNFTTPSGTSSDTLMNYEVGIRAGFFHDSLVFEPTLFWIDWSNIQTRLTRPDGITYGANAGDAVSRGAEITTSWTPVRGLRMQSNVTYLDAHLTDNVVRGGGLPDIPSGTALPTAAHWQFTETASYSFDNRFRPTITLLHHYIGHAKGALDTNFIQGDYNSVDVRFSAQLRNTALTFFVSNLTDSHGVTSGGSYGATPNGQQYFLLRPRTFGATLDWHL